MRALVISGGGSKGAFAGGVAEYLINDLKREYQVYVGSSTGSLLVPHLSIGEIGKVKEVFTNVSQKDIYSVCPFLICKNKDGTLKTKINHFNTLKMFLRGKKTFGEHYALKRTIQKTLTKDEFDKIQNQSKKVIITVSNLTRRRVEYKYANDTNYSDFMDWMWISSSFVPFMSLVKKNGFEYADGGFGNYIPIEEAINIGATEIDVIVLNPRSKQTEHIETGNAFDVLLQAMMFMQKQIAYDDILIGHLESIYNKDVNVNFFFTPRKLTDHSFIFIPEQMKKWWAEGYDYAQERCKKIKLCP